MLVFMLVFFSCLLVHQLLNSYTFVHNFFMLKIMGVSAYFIILNSYDCGALQICGKFG